MAIPLRVLIIEDSANDAALLLRELRKGGYRPTFARVDAAEAMAAALEKQPWDIIISDHGMPRFSATDALALLNDKGIDTPFIIVSGIMSEDAAVEAMRAGAQDYLRKGDLARLVPAITRELHEASERRERKRAQEALAAEQMRAQIAEQLYAEINHRMKNNLMMISGVLDMQLAGVPPESEVATQLRQTIARIGALSVLHESLYQGRPGKVELTDVLRRTAEVASRALSCGPLALSVKGEPVYASLKTGSTLAIVANELITNAIKHGAPAADGALAISIELARQRGTLRLSLWNSGNPVPADFAVSARKRTGLVILQGVVEFQLGGTLSIRPQGDGTLAEIVVGEAMLNPDEPAMGPGALATRAPGH